MCEGKFLVKTSVTTDNVIRQVTVEKFRFGVRVIKKPEGRWVCQDLNQIHGDSQTQRNLNNVSHGSLKDKFCRVSAVECPDSKESSLCKQLLQETSREKVLSVTTASSASLEASGFINNRTWSLEKNCQQLDKHDDHVTSVIENSHSHESVLGPRGEQFSPQISTSLDSILYRHLTNNKSIDSSKCYKPKVPPTHRSINSNNYMKKSNEFKSQYLSNILGPSPLLKLQLLNLYVAPLDGRNTFPELLPLTNVSRLRMLFDEDGVDKSGSGGTDADRDPKRVREMDNDRVELSKRVKIEPEDEDNLVIDENVGFGEDLSINSEESNENEEVPLIGISHQGSSANSVGSKRGSSDSSTEASNSNKNLKITIVKKNGHDANFSRVPKLTSNQSSSKVFEECNSTSNNSVDSKCSVNEKVLRLEREIQGLSSLLKTKEQEWNAILRLKKLKELEVEFLRRQKEVEEIFEDDTLQQHEDHLRKLGEKISVEVGKMGPDETDVRSGTEKTEKEIKDMEKKLKNSRVTAGNGKKENSKDLKQTDGHLENFKASLALQQLCERNRNSLAQANSPVQITSNASNANIQNKVIGEGRQGTIVEVRSIIADYRSKNPEETGSNQEARRRSQKKGSQQRSSSNTAGASIISQNQNVSFKDVLVNLAKLSQNEKTGVLTTLDNVTVDPRATSKANNVQTNSFSSQRGQLGTTLAKLLSSNNSSSSLPVGIVHPDDGNSVGSLKIEAVNHTSDSNLSLANLLASAKCRDDEIKTEDDDLVPICQGCNTNRAQFVCAGCGNQWYCCRECQIQAWEDHSEICSG